MPTQFSSNNAPVTIYLDNATGNPSKIEASSAAAASEAFHRIKSKEGPFNAEEIEEITGFIEDENLKSITVRDFHEINTCSNNGAHKSILLLCGSILEVFLYQSLSKKQDEANRFYKELKGKSLEMDMWFLGDMLTVSSHLGLIDAHFNGKARLITDYRNIIHPTNEIREKVGQIERLAPISIELIKMLITQIVESDAQQ